MHSLKYSILLERYMEDFDLVITNNSDYPDVIQIKSIADDQKEEVLLAVELEKARLLAKAINIICDNVEKQ